MRPLYISLNLLEIYHLKNLLAAEGIATTVKNELLSRLAGEIPFIECAPQLCLLSEADRLRAEEVVRDFRRPVTRGPAWRCAQCGEEIEGQFSACWRCGTERPG
jgi:hypothetical protein